MSANNNGMKDCPTFTVETFTHLLHALHLSNGSISRTSLLLRTLSADAVTSAVTKLAHALSSSPKAVPSTAPKCAKLVLSHLISPSVDNDRDDDRAPKTTTTTTTSSITNETHCAQTHNNVTATSISTSSNTCNNKSISMDAGSVNPIESNYQSQQPQHRMPVSTMGSNPRVRTSVRLVPLDDSTSDAVKAAGGHPYVEVILRASKTIWDVIAHLFTKWKLPLRIHISDSTHPQSQSPSLRTRLSTFLTSNMNISNNNPVIDAKFVLAVPQVTQHVYAAGFSSGLVALPDVIPSPVVGRKRTCALPPPVHMDFMSHTDKKKTIPKKRKRSNLCPVDTDVITSSHNNSTHSSSSIACRHINSSEGAPKHSSSTKSIGVKKRRVHNKNSKAEKDTNDKSSNGIASSSEQQPRHHQNQNSRKLKAVPKITKNKHGVSSLSHSFPNPGVLDHLLPLDEAIEDEIDFPVFSTTQPQLPPQQSCTAAPSQQQNHNVDSVIREKDEIHDSFNSSAMDDAIGDELHIRNQMHGTRPTNSVVDESPSHVIIPQSPPPPPPLPPFIPPSPPPLPKTTVIGLPQQQITGQDINNKKKSIHSIVDSENKKVTILKDNSHENVHANDELDAKNIVEESPQKPRNEDINLPESIPDVPEINDILPCPGAVETLLSDPSSALLFLDELDNATLTNDTTQLQPQTQQQQQPLDKCYETPEKKQEAPNAMTNQDSHLASTQEKESREGEGKGPEHPIWDSCFDDVGYDKIFSGIRFDLNAMNNEPPLETSNSNNDEQNIVESEPNDAEDDFDISGLIDL